MSSPSLGDQCCPKFISDTPHFVKMILGKNDAQKLRIPNKFATRYVREISNPVSINVPNGASWKVDLTMSADGTWLQNGWSELSEHYSLGSGSFLVFRYEGNCNFQLLIFNKCFAKFSLDTLVFFKIILDDTDLQKLMVPKMFERRHGSEISSSVSLKVPNGALWNVELTKCADGTWLHNGWSEFAKHYSLSYGSFMVFRYEGNCIFHVVICDTTATEISYPCGGTHGIRVSNGEGYQDHAMEDNKDDTSAEIMDDSPLSKKTKMRSSSTSCGIKSVFNVKRRGMRLQKMEVCKRKGTLRSKERANALRLARLFRSENPFFKVVMQPSYVYGKRLSLPEKFCRKYLLNCSADAILSICHGKTWPIAFSLNSKPKICSGWKKFLKENRLKVGDVCVFELIDQTKITFNVEIFRHVQDAETVPIPISKPCKRTNFNSGDNTPIDFLDDIPPSKETRVRLLSTSSQLRKKINTPKITCFKDSAIKSSGDKFEPNFNAKRSGKHPQQIEVCKRKGALQSEERANALHLSSSFSSKNPFFKVLMQPSYVNGKGLTISVDFCRKHVLIGHGDEIHIVCNGKTRSVVFSQNPCPKLSRGWMEFVKENNLEVGDVCVFELVNRTKITFNVVIFRHAQDETTGLIPEKDGSKCAPPQRLTGFKSENPFFVITIKPLHINRRVSVPWSFMNEHIEQDAVKLTLENGGKLWPVMVLFYEYPRSKVVYLGDGWGTFVRENSIKVGEECAFELINKEDAVLMVHIIRNKKRNSTSRDNISVEILDDIPSSKKTSMTSPSTSGLLHEKINSNSIICVKGSAIKSSEDKYGIPEPDFNAKRSGKRPLQIEVYRRKEALGYEGHANALLRVSSFTSINPFFKVVMQPSYVYGRELNVPRQFCREYLLNCSGDAILSTCHGKTWSVVINLNSKPKVQAGWKNFVEENHLEVGDVCVFELINQTEITFNVEIFRHAQDAKPCLAAAAEDDGKCLSLSAPPQILSSFKSENPFFLITIRPAYTLKVLVPYSFIKEHIKQDAVNLTLEDGGKLWPAKVLLYEYPARNRASAYIGGGWCAFATENSVKVGDDCAFELINKEDAVLRVHLLSESAQGKMLISASTS